MMQAVQTAVLSTSWFMNSNGTVKSTVEINDTTPNGPTLSNSDNFGNSVSAIGDLDGDGVTDIAAGANNDDAGGTDRGAVHIISLNVISTNGNGKVDHTVEINDTTPNGPTLSNADLFGSSVSAIGDLNGDGVTDIAAGAIFDDAGGTDRGALHIMFMNSNGTVKNTVEINDTTPNGPTLSNDDNFGYSVSAIGDLDGDGVTDIAAGAISDDAGGTGRGALHIMFMNSNGTVKNTVEINDTTPNGPTLSDSDQFGYSVSAIGDLDGDGVTDIAAGANNDDAGGSGRGAVHIMFMNSNGTVKSTVEINDNTPNGPTLSNDDNFGTSVSAIGDLDGDGVTDIAAGAFGDDGGGSGRGALHIMFMNSNGTVKNTVEINDTTPNGPTLSDSDNFGRSVSAIGDLDGDGVTDIAAGAFGDDGGGTDRGALHIMFMNSNGTVKNTVEINDTTPNGPTLSNIDFFGISVSAIGDLNGDGVTDIAAGANGDGAGDTFRGAVHIMYLDKNTVVQSVFSNTADGTYGSGSVIDVRVLFSESVTVTGSPQILLETGTTDRNAVFASGSTTNTLIFQYTVQSGDASADLNYVSTGSLALNGGTITATASPNDAAVLTLPPLTVTALDYNPADIFGSLGLNDNLIIDTGNPGSTSGRFWQWRFWQWRFWQWRF